MKLCSNHKTCSDKLLNLLVLDKFLILPHMKDKMAVGFTKHRLNLVDADVTVFSGLVLGQGQWQQYFFNAQKASKHKATSFKAI